MPSPPEGLPARPAPIVTPRVADALVLVFVIIGPTVGLIVHGTGSRVSVSTAALLVDGAIGALLIVLRRRWPIPVLGVGLVLTVAMMAVTGHRGPSQLAILILVYTVASTTEPRPARLVGAGTIIVLAAAVPLFLDEPLVGPETLATIAWVALALAGGEAQRNRRNYLEAVEQRMRWAEETREEEARRQVAEERLHIARELHDVVAHRLALVNVQASVAAHHVRDRPDEAEQALATVRSEAAMVLDEMGGLLQVLRSGDHDAPLEPAPTLAQLDALVRSFTAAGLEVVQVTEGAVRPAPESVQLAAYRLVQESLTNAHKHGTGAAQLRLTYTPSALDIDIQNPIDHAAERIPSRSLGLLGIRERVAAVGGTVDINPTTDHRFRVAAHLPLVPPRERP